MWQCVELIWLVQHKVPNRKHANKCKIQFSNSHCLMSAAIIQPPSHCLICVIKRLCDTRITFETCLFWECAVYKFSLWKDNTLRGFGLLWGFSQAKLTHTETQSSLCHILTHTQRHTLDNPLISSPCSGRHATQDSGGDSLWKFRCVSSYLTQLPFI